MTETQYRQVLANRRARGARPVLDGRRAQNVLRAAARRLRRRARARELLGALLGGDWLAAVQVESLEAGTLTLTVGDAAIWAGLRRRRRTLQRQMAAGLPGLRRVRFVLAPRS